MYGNFLIPCEISMKESIVNSVCRKREIELQNSEVKISTLCLWVTGIGPRTLDILIMVGSQKIHKIVSFQSNKSNIDKSVLNLYQHVPTTNIYIHTHTK